MEQQYGTFGTGTNTRGQVPGVLPDPGNQGKPPLNQQPLAPGGGLPQDRGAVPGQVDLGELDSTESNYVSSTITFNGESWQNVGFRYSGNSTLKNAWTSGVLKISFRLDFDEFEDLDESITDQRFYGFKQLSFKSNAMDASYLRDKVTADIFREAGVASSQTAFYEVYIDYGEGSTYFGIYTAVEIVDDTVIESQFADDSGNVYKPEGTGASFQEGSFNEASFEKQTNQDEADWSDIQAVFDALHSDLRTSDPAAWRANLESVFDVDAFLRWLAVDTIIQNWDTYGVMTHNYYLYTDPSDGLVTWIPWDNNEALSSNSKGSAGGNSNRGVRELDLSNVSDQWPLISYLADDPVYMAKYQQYLQETIENVWQPESLAQTYQEYHDLIAPYVENETEGFTYLASIREFDLALETLIAHAQARYDAVNAYLTSQ